MQKHSYNDLALSGDTSEAHHLLEIAHFSTRANWRSKISTGEIYGKISPKEREQIKKAMKACKFGKHQPR